MIVLDVAETEFIERWVPIVADYFELVGPPWLHDAYDAANRHEFDHCEDPSAWRLVGVIVWEKLGERGPMPEVFRYVVRAVITGEVLRDGHAC